MFAKRIWTKIVGDRAERSAARFLRRSGFTIVERNVTIGRDEIDIVGVERGIVVFVEVRYRAAGIGAAAESIDFDKVKALQRAAASYRTREGLWEVPARYDFVLVTEKDGKREFSHIRGAIDV
jgi:putative endonuclease